ncbi:MAG: hypothetical protein U0T32_01210 [Chitinophagales bacterium]
MEKRSAGRFILGEQLFWSNISILEYQNQDQTMQSQDKEHSSPSTLPQKADVFH